MTKWKKIAYTIASVFSLGVVILVILPAFGRPCGTQAMRDMITFTSIIRQTGSAIQEHYDNHDTRLETVHLLVKYPECVYPVHEATKSLKSETVPSYDGFLFSSLTYDSILAGTVDSVRIREEASRLGTSDASWERVGDVWFSKQPADYRQPSADVFIAFTRQRFDDEDDGETTVFLFQQINLEMVKEENTTRAMTLLDANRAARERLGLAPFPPEFESWLLTGEPASVGDGTFVPPRLGGDADGE